MRRLARRRVARIARAADANALRTFHARCKYLLMACDPAGTRGLGAIAARARPGEAAAFAEYARVLDAVLAAPPAAGGHENALLHMFGYVSERLPAEERSRFRGALAAYRRGTGGLDAPVHMLRAWIGAQDVAYLEEQYYFEAFLSR